MIRVAMVSRGTCCRLSEDQWLHNDESLQCSDPPTFIPTVTVRAGVTAEQLTHGLEKLTRGQRQPDDARENPLTDYVGRISCIQGCPAHL